MLNVEKLELALFNEKQMNSAYYVEQIDWPHSHTIHKLIDKSKETPPVYIKEYEDDEESRNRAASEIAAITLLRNLSDIHVPEVTLISHEESTISYLVEEEIAGVPLESQITTAKIAELAPTIEKTAYVLAQIHAIKLLKFGSIAKDGLTFNSWRECLEHDVVDKLIYLTKSDLLSIPQVSLFERILGSDFLSLEESPTLTHGDYEPRNLLIDPISLQLMGLIDFESSKAWVSNWDLTRISAIAFAERPELLKIFLKAYCAETGIDLKDTCHTIDKYRPFESLHFWAWGWGRNQSLDREIIRDVDLVTGGTNAIR